MSATETADKAPDAGASEKRTLSMGERLVVVGCVLGILVATGFALASADIDLLNAHMFEVIADSWSSNATVGLIVALVTAVAVGIFVIILGRATIASDDEGDPE